MRIVVTSHVTSAGVPQKPGRRGGRDGAVNA
jgi:hypothetical protein